MKKLGFLAFLLLISISGICQPAQKESISHTIDGFLPKYLVQDKYSRIPVKQLASESVIIFKLIDFTRTTEKNWKTGGKQFTYQLFLMRRSDGQLFEIKSYDKQLLLSALNDDSYYFYYDGKKIFVKEKFPEYKTKKRNKH